MANEEIVSKTYSKNNPNKLVRYETTTHVASLHVVGSREEWHRFNKQTGKIERLDYDNATGEKKWVKQDVGIVMEAGGEAEIEIDVDLTVEKDELEVDPLGEIQKTKEQLT
jgi:hypothetical protein